MKKLILFFLIGACFACKKQDQDTKQTTTLNPQVIGKWIYMKDTIRQYRNTILTNQYNNGGLDLGTASVVFSADGTCQQLFNGSLTTFTYTSTDTQITYKNSSTIAKTAAIKKVTSTELILFVEYNSTDNGGNIIRQTESSYLTKQ